MPVTSGKNVGSQNIAKGGANLYAKTGVVGASNINTPVLECPGLPKLTWIISQTAGGAGATVVPQVAIRRLDSAGPGQPALFDFQSIAPPAILDPGGTPTVFEFNCPVQAMQLNLTINGAGTNITTILAASG